MELRTYGRNFWKQSFERGVKTAAQAAAGLFIADQPFDILQFNGLRALGVAVGGFVLSIVTSIATAPMGPADDPSMARPDH